MVACAIKCIYDVVKIQRHHEKSTYWKDEIGHSCNLVEKKTKIHPNLKISRIGHHS